MPDSTPTAIHFQSAKEIIDSCAPEHVRLYLVLRVLQTGIPRSRQALNKYTYNVCRLDVDSRISENLLADIRSQTSKILAQPELEFSTYSVIADDLNDVVYCAPSQEVGSVFAEAVYSQLNQGIAVTTIQQLKSVANDVWAICLAFEVPGQVVVQTFARLSKGQIGISENEQNRWLTYFSTSDDKLIPMEGTTLSLPRHVAFLRYQDEVFFLRKKETETVLGLDDEYAATAETLMSELDGANCINGMQFLRIVSQKSPTVNKTLAHIARIGSHQNLTPARFTAIQELIDLHGLKIRVENDTIHVDDEGAVRDLLKVLNDYYVESKQTGMYYGANAKKPLNTRS
jgi:hypothetical protein